MTQPANADSSISKSTSTGSLGLLNGSRVGFVQRYRVGDEEGLAEILGVDLNAQGLDLFLGDQQLLGRGLGTRMVREFGDLVLQDPSVAYLVIDPDTENAAAIACYRKAGFTPLRETVDLLDASRRSLLMERRLASSKSTVSRSGLQPALR